MQLRIGHERRGTIEPAQLVELAIPELLAPDIEADEVMARAQKLLVNAFGSGWLVEIAERSAADLNGRVFARVPIHPASDAKNDELIEIRGTSHIDGIASFATLVAASVSVARTAAEARRLALTDQLTGLYNYRFFAQRIVEEAERGRRYRHPLALVMLDSDALKRINDHFGHEQGNLHIQEIADTIRAHVRTSDITVRWGGDEFLIIQPECRLGQAVAIAERIQLALVSRPFEGQDGTAVLRHVSAGVASWPETAQDPEDLFDQADQALYRAKRSGERIVIAPRQQSPMIETDWSARVSVGG